MYLKVYLILAWLIIAAISAYAIFTLGPDFFPYYIGDILGHAWRRQFNIDFLGYLVLFAGWIYWREESRTTGVICAVLSFLGAIFSFLYLLHRLHQAKGDIKRLLLGRHA